MQMRPQRVRGFSEFAVPFCKDEVGAHASAHQRGGSGGAVHLQQQSDKKLIINRNNDNEDMISILLHQATIKTAQAQAQAPPARAAKTWLWKANDKISTLIQPTWLLLYPILSFMAWHFENRRLNSSNGVDPEHNGGVVV